MVIVMSRSKKIASERLRNVRKAYLVLGCLSCIRMREEKISRMTVRTASLVDTQQWNSYTRTPGAQLGNILHQ